MKNFAIYRMDFAIIRYIRIHYQENAITLLQKVDKPKDFGIKNDVTENVYNQLLEYFSGKRKDFTLPYKMHGTEFQKKVWQALCNIPYGETRSYKDIATAIGNPNASRAVGMANNKNKIGIVIPCHRVIGTDGKLIGYAGGLKMKKFLLQLEQQQYS